jgi:hypothetical protein
MNLSLSFATKVSTVIASIKAFKDGFARMVIRHRCRAFVERSSSTRNSQQEGRAMPLREVAY